MWGLAPRAGRGGYIRDVIAAPAPNLAYVIGLPVGLLATCVAIGYAVFWVLSRTKP